MAADRGRIPDAEVNEHLKRVIAPLFDFEEMSRRSLGAYWKKGSEAEQEEFVERFSDLLARTYLKRITQGVQLIEVVEITEKVEGDRATVNAKIAVKGIVISTEARMLLKSDGWKIYDVAVENIGLVSNYRNEFPAIVRKEGFRGLIDRLKKKQDARQDLPLRGIAAAVGDGPTPEAAR